MTGPERAQFRARKQEAKKVARMNIQKACAEQYPEVVGKCQVCKWTKAAEREGWEHLPETAQAREVTTCNGWRVKRGLPSRGRETGGAVPQLLQKELDRLIMLHAQGMSEISERSDIVTSEHIVTCPSLSKFLCCSTLT